MNKKKHFILLVLLSCLFFVSCDNSKIKSVNKITYKPGVVLSFDDHFIDEWCLANQKLKSYDWKATFCISKINDLSALDISKLVELQNEGHEIAGHTLNHLNAENFVKVNGIQKYIDQEINPMLDIMNNRSLTVSSFAYPFGAKNTQIDMQLLKKFQIIRGTTYGSFTPSQENCFFNNNHPKVVYGLGMDSNYAHFSIKYILELLEYAKNNNKILLLYGHRPVANVTGDYQVKMESLEIICDYVKENNMKFYTLSDLNAL